MLYTIRNTDVIPFSPEEYSPEELCVGCLTLNELRGCYARLGISDYAMNESTNNLLVLYNSVEVYDTFSFGTINVIDVLNLGSQRKRVGFLFQKNLFLLIRMGETAGSELDDAIRRGLIQLHRPATMEKMVCSILDQLFLSGNQELIFTERMSNVLELQVEDREHATRLEEDLFELRSRISVLRTFSAQMLDIGETLLADKNNLLDSEPKLYLQNLVTRAERMGARAQTLSEDLLHLWELLDARMNQRMNNTMNVLAIVSIIFQPMGVIAGWYGMNFITMPEFNWQYGYIYVILLNLFIVVALTLFFKKKKLL